MPSLKKMRARTDQVKVNYDGEDTTVTWRPGLLTMRFEERLQDLLDEWRGGRGKASAALRELREKLAGEKPGVGDRELIVAWDLTEEEGPISETNPMVPISADTLADLPDGFTAELVDRIMEEAGGGKARQISDSGEPPAGQQGPSPRGHHSFG